MKMTRVMPALALALFCATSAFGASFSISYRLPSAAEIGNAPELASQYVYTASVTTDADILQFDTLSTPTPLYQNAFGTDAEAPNPAFIGVFPALGADSYVTTPGATSIAGAGFGSLGSAWFDTSDNGPQNGFVFAQLTSPVAPVDFLFTGNIQLRGAQGPVIESFALRFVPEPASAVLLGSCLIGLAISRRRNG